MKTEPIFYLKLSKFSKHLEYICLKTINFASYITWPFTIKCIAEDSYMNKNRIRFFRLRQI